MYEKIKLIFLSHIFFLNKHPLSTKANEGLCLHCKIIIKILVMIATAAKTAWIKKRTESEKCIF
jgi:hypothetical protein